MQKRTNYTRQWSKIMTTKERIRNSITESTKSGVRNYHEIRRTILIADSIWTIMEGSYLSCLLLKSLFLCIFHFISFIWIRQLDPYKQHTHIQNTKDEHICTIVDLWPQTTGLDYFENYSVYVSGPITFITCHCRDVSVVDERFASFAKKINLENEL